MSDSLKDILYGSISGSIGKIIEYPFDTVKVRLQSNNSYISTTHCITTTIQNEGLRGFYRGLTSPLVGASLETSCLFVSYNLSIKQFAKLKCVSIDELSLRYKVVSGAVSGICASFIITPVELVKCKLQTSSQKLNITQLVSQIVKQDGLKGMWKGQLATVLREAGGTACWFGTFEYTTKLFRDQNRTITNSKWETLCCGALAGVSYNLSLFPLDTVKSQMQTSDTNHSLWKTATQVYQQGGVRWFYRGLGVTLIRAVPSNAVIFYTYELLKQSF